MKTFDTRNLGCKILKSLFLGAVALSLLAIIDVHFARAEKVTLGDSNGPFYCSVPLEGDIVSCDIARYSIEFVLLFLTYLLDGLQYFASNRSSLQPAIAFCVTEVALLHQLIRPGTKKFPGESTP